jgi:hypothetical protein
MDPMKWSCSLLSTATSFLPPLAYRPSERSDQGRCFRMETRLALLTSHANGYSFGLQRCAGMVDYANVQAHAEISQDFSKTYRLVQPFLVTSGVTTQEEVERAYQEMQAGLQLDDFNAVGFYLTTWGRKP